MPTVQYTVHLANSTEVNNFFFSQKKQVWKYSRICQVVYCISISSFNYSYICKLEENIVINKRITIPFYFRTFIGFAKQM